MNKIDLLNEFKDKLYNNLLCYSENQLMVSPKYNYLKEWKETKEKIKIIEEIIRDEQERNGEIEFIVRDEHCDLCKSFSWLHEAIEYAEKEKREYLRNYDDSKIWIHINGQDEKIYEAKGYYEESEELE